MVSSRVGFHRSIVGWALLGALLGSPACGSTGSPDDDTPGTGGGASGGARGDGGAVTGGSAQDGGRSSGGEVATGGERASGGQGSGGDAGGESPSGGQGLGGDGSGGDAGDPCIESTLPTAPAAARSLGFSGTDAEYSELYDQPCIINSDCVAPCTARGGTTDFCSTSICIDSEPDYCLPPTKWRAVSQALDENATVYEAAVTSLSVSNGSAHDRLILDDFGLEIPESATILGITVSIRRAAGGVEEASDQIVRIIKGGVIGEEAREKPGLWPLELTNEEYGGSTDLWGETWTAADLNAPDFGVAVAALPATYGGRAYVDIAYVQIHYKLSCD